MTYLLKLKDKKEIAKGTMAFYFERPKGFSFTAGQSMRLKHPRKNEDRVLSIVNSPDEDELVFAMRMRKESEYKKVFSELVIGTEIEAEGPLGMKFILHEDSTVPAVCIAGGIGITPLLSMIRYILEQNHPYEVILFYSNRYEEDISFSDELKKAADERDNFTFIPTLSRKYEASASWEGERGRIDEEMIRRYVPDLSVPMFYVAGPPDMVQSMKVMLGKAGIDTNRIKTKTFSGYE